MKSLTIVVLLALCSTHLFAQNKTISRDTINIQGVLLANDGKPAPNIRVLALQNDPKNGKYTIVSTSDNNGQFVLNGVMPEDTILLVSQKFDIVKYYNHGSRFITMLLPPEQIKDLTPTNPVEISATRTSPKKTATLEIQPQKTITRLTFNEPGFPGGNQMLLRYIQQQLKYPEKAIENNIEGEVQVLFTVQSDGALSDFFVLKGLGYGCDDEVVSILAHCPKFKPGTLDGSPIPVQFSVSVKFSLKDK